jgi:hypothetical protein
MVLSGDVPSDFNLASFFVRPDFRVFQHNRPEADLAQGWGSAHWGGKGLFPVSWRVSSGMRPLARVERSGGSADLHFLLGEEDLSAGALLR